MIFDDLPINKWLFSIATLHKSEGTWMYYDLFLWLAWVASKSENAEILTTDRGRPQFVHFWKWTSNFVRHSCIHIYFICLFTSSLFIYFNYIQPLWKLAGFPSWASPFSVDFPSGNIVAFTTWSYMQAIRAPKNVENGELAGSTRPGQRLQKMGHRNRGLPHDLPMKIAWWCSMFFLYVYQRVYI
jgi:hypothetical protein